MTVRKLSVEATIKRYTNENGFSWGINTVMKSLAPDASYDLTSAGEFIIDRWDSPLPQQICPELRRQCCFWLLPKIFQQQENQASSAFEQNVPCHQHGDYSPHTNSSWFRPNVPHSGWDHGYVDECDGLSSYYSDSCQFHYQVTSSCKLWPCVLPWLSKVGYDCDQCHSKCSPHF